MVARMRGKRVASIQASGVSGSGLDVNGLVSQLMAAERAPNDQRFRSKENTITTKLSALGSIKSSLAALRDSLDALGSADSLAGRSVENPGSGSFRVTAGQGATLGNYSIEVISLASTHKLASSLYSSGPSSDFGNGNLTISQGADSFSFAVGSGTTLAQLVDLINNDPNNTGVNASLLTTAAGSRLVLSASEPGVSSEISLTGKGSLDVFTSGFTEAMPASDAVVKIDGITLTSGSNILEDVIEGLTITLLNAQPGSTFNVGVTYDRAGAREKLDDFVKKYNAFTATAQRTRAFDPGSNTAGPLIADSAVRSMEMQLRREITEPTLSAPAEFNSVLALGFKFDRNGRLSVDETRFSAALEANLEEVTDVFTAADGLVPRMRELVNAQLDSDGMINVRTESLNASRKRLQDDRQRAELRLEMIERRYRDQFIALDQMLLQMQSMNNSLAQLGIGAR
jgi:flagellar hook-associated protein 2